MAAYARSGTTATGTTSVIATCPTCNVGDLLEFQVETNGSAATTPSGWTATGTLTVANSRRQVVYTKLATSVDVWGMQTYTASGLTSGTTSAGRIHVIAPTVAGGALTIPTSTVGTDTSISSTAYSAAGSSITTTTGDYFTCAYLVTSSTAVLTAFGSSALTQASATIGSSTQRQFATGSAGLYGLGLQTAAITTGGTGIPTMAGNGTGSATVGGVAHFIPIHETSASGNVLVNGPTEFPGSGGSLSPFSYTSVKVGDIIVLMMGGFDSTPLLTGVSSAHGTWAKAVSSSINMGGGTITSLDLWWCKVTTVTTGNVTVTKSGTNTIDVAVIAEYDSQLGTSTTWSVSDTGTGSSSTNATPTVSGLAPTAGDLVTVFLLPGSSVPGTTMTPAGFVGYQTPVDEYGYGHQLIAAGGSITPTWTGAGSQPFTTLGASFTPSAGTTYNADLAQSVTATQAATALLTAVSAATQAVTATQATAAVLTRQLDAAQPASATQTAAALLVARADAAQAVAASQSATASLTRIVDAAESVVATQAATISLTRKGDASQPVTVSQATTALLVALADAAQTITATQTAAASVIHAGIGADAAQSVTATQTASGLLTAIAAATQAVAASQTATASRTTRVDTAQSVTATQAATISRTTRVDTAQAVTATQTAAAALVRLADLAQQVAATQLAAASLTRVSTGAQSVTAAQTATITITASVNGAQTVVVTQTADATVTPASTVALPITVTGSTEPLTNVTGSTEQAVSVVGSSTTAVTVTGSTTTAGPSVTGSTTQLVTVTSS